MTAPLRGGFSRRDGAADEDNKMKKIIIAACALALSTAFASAQMGQPHSGLHRGHAVHRDHGMGSFNMMHKNKMMHRHHHMMKKRHMM